MKEEILTGIIPYDEKPIVFSADKDNYKFTFMTNETYSFGEKNTELLSSDGFIYGTTHDNYTIAIYVGETKLKFSGVQLLNICAYVKSKGNVGEQDISTFDTLAFHGGTLNSVFHMRAMQVDHSTEDTIVKYKDDSIKYSVKTLNYEFDVEIRSEMKTNFSTKGRSINNNEVVMILRFKEPQPLRTFFEHYNHIKDMLSFMCFRENVGFDSVVLSRKGPHKNSIPTTAIAHVFNESDLTKKKIFDNICFENLTEILPKFTSIFYEKENTKGDYIILGFMPENDKNIFSMNDQKIRNICSSLECELTYVKDIEVEENEMLLKLIESTKAHIKEFRNNNEGIDSNTYNKIFSSMSYWSLPLTEKLCALNKKYFSEMNQLNLTGRSLNDSDIGTFVKYRNTITHGRHQILNDTVATTAYFLCGLIYCCVLTRAGLSRENLKLLCERRILG